MKAIFNITNRYIILTTPLILYTLVSSIYFAVSAYNTKFVNLLIAMIILMLITVTFLSGWFNMIKNAILDPQREDVNALIKEFPAGVGEYFLSILGSSFLILFLTIITLLTAYFCGIKIIGDIGITPDAFSKALENTTQLKMFLQTLTKDQLIKINLWNMLIIVSMTLEYFLIFLYMPTIFFKTKNAFKAFFISLKDLFSKHLAKTTGIFLLIFIINFFISIISAIFGSNTFIHFCITLLNFYFITIVAVGIFYYYFKTFIKTNKPE